MVVLFVLAACGGNDGPETPELGVTWTRVVESGPYESPGQSHTWPVAAAHEDALWVVIPSGEVWTSPDGISWSMVSASAPADVALIVSFQGELWAEQFVLDGPGVIWSSPDGVDWTERGSVTFAPPTLPGGERRSFVAWDDRLWFFSTEVLSSPDGVTWTQVTPSGPTGIAVVLVFDDRLYSIGDDRVVRTSDDGANWSEIRTDAPYMFAEGAVVADGRLWIVGEDVWSSTDGVAWELVRSGLELAKRIGGEVVSRGPSDAHLFFIGGGERVGDGLTFINDVWTSP